MNRPASSLTFSPMTALLLPFPFVCFSGCLITDLAYWRSTNIQWETFSIWLLTAGLIMAGVAVLAAAFDFLVRSRDRTLMPSWPRLLGFVVALGLALVNAFIHSGDGFTDVVPNGVALSAIVVLILLLAGWNGFAVSHRHASKEAN